MGYPASRLTDIWALGILFYEMLTGTAPFNGSTLAELHGQISNARYEDPRRLNSAVSNEVAAIVERCLNTDVRQRYASVDAMLSDIVAALRRRQHPSADAAKISGMRDLFTRTGSLDSNGDGRPANHGSGLVRMALIASGSAVVLAVVVFGLWAMSGSTPAAVANEPPATPKPLAAKNTKPRVVTQGGTSSARAKARIDVTEGVAQVYRDGQLLGTTPVEIDGNENETVNLTLKRTGYQDLSETIEITTRRTVFTFTLRKSR